MKFFVCLMVRTSLGLTLCTGANPFHTLERHFWEYTGGQCLHLRPRHQRIVIGLEQYPPFTRQCPGNRFRVLRRQESREGHRKD